MDYDIKKDEETNLIDDGSDSKVMWQRDKLIQIITHNKYMKQIALGKEIGMSKTNVSSVSTKKLLPLESI